MIKEYTDTVHKLNMTSAINLLLIVLLTTLCPSDLGRDTKMQTYNLVFTKGLELSNFCSQVNVNFLVLVYWRMSKQC